MVFKLFILLIISFITSAVSFIIGLSTESAFAWFVAAISAIVWVAIHTIVSLIIRRDSVILRSLLEKRLIRFRCHISLIETSPNFGDAAMTVVLKDNQKVSIGIAPVDAKGNTAKIDGAPVWTVADATIVTLVPSEDGMSCVATAAAIGTTQITISADADLGEGVTTITGLVDIEVTGGVATGLNVTVGTPEDVVSTTTTADTATTDAAAETTATTETTTA